MGLKKSEMLGKTTSEFIISSIVENMLHNCLLKVAVVTNYELTITNYDDYECFEK